MTNKSLAAILAAISFATMNLLTIIIHVFVAVEIIPYTYIGGGRLADQQSAVFMAVFSSILLILETAFILFACSLLRGGKKRNPAVKIILWLLLAQFAVNLVLNILGKSWFERIVMSIICLVQIVILCYYVRIFGKGGGEK